MKNTIREFLEKRGITRYRFYKDVGIAPKTAYDLYGNPDQLPASTVLAKICDTYKVQPGELLVWEGAVGGPSAAGGEANGGGGPSVEGG